MSKKTASKRKRPAKSPTLPRVRFWPALIAGILLVALGAALWVTSSKAVFNSALLRKLPKDSSIAGVARLSQFDRETVQQVSQNAKIDPARSTVLLQAMSEAHIDPKLVGQALDDQFAFARTTRGDLAVFTIRSEESFNDLAKRASSQTHDAKISERQANGGTFKTWQAVINGNQETVFAYRSGQELYLSTNPELIIGASRENAGFTSLDQFAGVSKQLTAGADAYLFLNASQLKDPPVAFPLTGIAINNHKNGLKLSMQVAEPAVVTTSLKATNGSLLPSTESAAASLEGTNVAAYLHLLEQQRQESDLPRVISLQNGIASLNRTIGIDLERDIFGAATGPFVYARYRSADGAGQWFGAIEFDSDEIANAKVAQLTKLLRERVKVPTRHEVVRTLQDGTQSREIVSQGNEPLEITDMTVENKGGNAANFPGMGSVNWLVDGKYLVIGSTPEAVGRMVKTIAQPTGNVGERGELAVRSKLPELPGLMGGRDGLFNWILATQPESGTFSLSKATGELQGAVRFKQAGK
jgi:hypothetical protein